MCVPFLIVCVLSTLACSLSATDTVHATSAPETLVLSNAVFTKPDWATNERRQSDGSIVFSRELVEGAAAGGVASDAERLARREVERSFPVLRSRLKLRGTSPRTKETLNAEGKRETQSDGYLVQYDVAVDGIRVWDDYVTVSVRGNAVEAVSLRGHAVETASAKRPVLALKEAVEKSRREANLATFDESDFELHDAELCYISSTPTKNGSGKEPQPFVLSWHVPVNERTGSRRGSKMHVWIDAYSGRLLAKKPF
jgi:hypothetical protein